MARLSRVLARPRGRATSRLAGLWLGATVCVILAATSCSKAIASGPSAGTNSPGNSTLSPAGSTGSTVPAADSGTTAPAKTTSTSRAGTAPATANWKLVTEPGDGMQPIYSLISSADHELDMTMYELADPEAETLLEADASRGVVVRVLLDRDYSGASVNAAAYSDLQAHGVQVHWASSGTIFHQKTITVDDHTSAIMTLNLTSQYYATTRDFAVITTDGADVGAIEEVFGEDWANSGAPQAGPPGANLVWSPGATAALVDLIGSARHSLLVENEEMDDSEVTAALQAAARRGVDVEVVMADSSSWADSFDELASAGVKVRTYSADASLYIHAKVIVVDGATAFVGSQNFSESSLDYNRELGLVTTDASIVDSIAKTVEADFAGGTAWDSGGSSSTTSPASGGAWCTASASPADDGYSGDYDVDVHSNQPDKTATASDAGDTYSYETDSSGYAEIRLWDTSAGELITVTVGAARCTTTA
ncbi:MAG: phospholipase D-like domain-containing protein [Acidimicrobiales bacterium]